MHNYECNVTDGIYRLKDLKNNLMDNVECTGDIHSDIEFNEGILPLIHEKKES